MANLVQDNKIEQYLLKQGKLTLNQIAALKEEQKKTRKTFFNFIAEKNILSRLDLVKLKGEILEVPFVDLEKKQVQKALLYSIPEKLARKYKAIAFDQIDEGPLKIAMADPSDLQAVEFLQKRVGREVEIYITVPETIEKMLDNYTGLEGEIEKTIAEGTGEFIISDIDELKKSASRAEDAIKEDAPIAKAVSAIIENAVRSKSSDIHIEPQEKKIEIRYRLDGVLHKKLTLPKAVLAAIVSRVKILSNLKIDETRLPQDGRIRMIIDSKEVDFRVSTLPTVNGEKVVMRVLDTSSGILTLEQLGLRGHGLEVVGENISRPHGMILVTGPTGSGKSTTLYAVIDRLNAEGVNIITLEDPVEYFIEGINQVQIKTDIGLTFASGLRSILRQDPDIVMVGEIRDTETAEMAVHAALTGHVVLSTLHTNTAAGAIPRLIDMGVEPFLIASSINVSVAQRLARKICEDCKEDVKVPKEVVAEIKREVSKMPAAAKKDINLSKIKLKKGKGCNNCSNTGYRGRIGIFEVLPITEPVQELAIKRASDSQIQEQAIKEGMLTMQQDGILKVLDGTTTMEEVLRVTED